MQTVTVDILNEKAYRLLEDLEALEVIRLRRPAAPAPTSGTGIPKLRGSLPLKKSVEETEDDLRKLRDEWERDFS